MRNTAFFLVGFALLVLETQMFRIIRILLDVLGWMLRVVHLASGPIDVPGLVPSLLLPLILFMGVHEYHLSLGACVVFALGYLTDILGIAPVGLHAFTFVAVFVLARSAGVRLGAQTKLTQAILALGFALVHSIMVLVLLAIFGNDAWVPRAVYPLTLPHVLSTAAIAPLVFMLAQKVHAATTTSKRAEAGGEPS
jgi:rod shape-determining protein MreD